MKAKGTTILIIILSALVLSVLASFLLYGPLREHVFHGEEHPEQGRWRLARVEQPIDKEQAYHRLLSLGYLQGYNPASKHQNVILWKKDLAYNGLNFCLSAHAPEAFLMTMEGKILHKWSYESAASIWPADVNNKAEASYWRRAFLYENGDILAIYENYALIKLDKNSQLVWAYTSSKKPHHDIEVAQNGITYILTGERKIIPWINKENPVKEDFITLLDPSGNPIKHISLIELLAKSKYKKLLTRRISSPQLFDVSRGDILHTNTLEVFDGKHADKSHLFLKGNVLVSFLTIDTIAIVDLKSEEIIWALGPGLWTKQHQPTLLKNGNFMIFDNLYSENRSRVAEFEPFTHHIVWEYKGDSEIDFFSRFLGSNQRLPNGNTLITESDNGRVFEVTKDNEIVWEYINPHRAGENNELIATLPEVIRIEPEYCSFLENHQGSPL